MNNTNALISVYDKEGLLSFAQELTTHKINIISTGGTAHTLQQAQIPITQVSDLTGFPEMLNGRVKTLHPRIHAGILAQRTKKHHLATLTEHNIPTIDFVICNLYPFEQTIKKPRVSIEEVIENIDIGGPTLIRAAAKNYHDVVVITNPQQYQMVIDELKQDGTISLETREKLAVEAYAHTAQYDTMIAQYLRTIWGDEQLPKDMTITMRKIQALRYGENPHQKAAFYKAIPETHEPCITTTHQLHGKELSYNNILDSDCAIECIKEFHEPSCVIIKHATPCGIASASTLLQAWTDAYATDIYSPFGGIVAFNHELTNDVAAELTKHYLEVVIAPSYHSDSLHVLEQKKNIRILELPKLDAPIERHGLEYRSVAGGYLAQERDTWFSSQNDWHVVTTKKPDEKDLRAMEFAIRCVKHVKSNSVLFVKDTKTVAIGGGQTSRVDSTWIAAHKGKEHIQGSIMASDAFFPFRDAVDVAAEAGVKAIIQPGGSVRDDEVIKAANEHNLIMVFSHQRYFRH